MGTSEIKNCETWIKPKSVARKVDQQASYTRTTNREFPEFKVKKKKLPHHRDKWEKNLS